MGDAYDEAYAQYIEDLGHEEGQRMSQKKEDPISIAITLGKGASAAITEGNQLIIEQGDLRIDLGGATVWKIDMIIKCMEHIKIHAVDYKRKEK